MLVLCHDHLKAPLPTREEIEDKTVTLNGRKIVGVVDGCEQQVNRSRNKPLYDMTFSGKKSKNTFTALSVVAPDGTPLFRSLSQPGSRADNTLSRLDEMLPLPTTEDEYIMGDIEFYGMDEVKEEIVLPFKKNGQPLKSYETEFNHLMDGLRIVVENHFAQVKKYAVCSFPFHVNHFSIEDSLNLHNMFWEAVTGIVKQKGPFRQIESPFVARAFENSFEKVF
jgi:hypothetical protein